MFSVNIHISSYNLTKLLLKLVEFKEVKSLDVNHSNQNLVKKIDIIIISLIFHFEIIVSFFFFTFLC